MILTEEEIIDKIINYCKLPKSAKDIAKHLQFSDIKHFRNKYLKKLILLDKLRYTNTQHTNASNQKYSSI